MRSCIGNVHYALRQFRLAPVFTVSAVLTLALGIGGTTAIFSLIHAVMLRSLPVADPASLYRIGDGNDCCVESAPQDRWGMFSFALYQRLKAATPEFAEVAAFQAAVPQFPVRRARVEPVAQSLRGEYVSGNYFSTLGVRSFAGRLLGPTDDQLSATPVAVLSYRAWRDKYGSDPSVLGSSYFVEDHAFTVIGIAPPGFYGDTLRSDPPEIWLPLHQETLIDGPKGSLLSQPAAAWLRVVGRLRPEATVAGMPARLTEILRQWIKAESGYPAAWMPTVLGMLPKQTINVVPAGGGVAEMKEKYGSSLQILLSVCGLVLLIACANVANLMLARSMARRSDTALRLAVGASARGLVLQCLTESVLLSIGGGLAGLLVAYGTGRLLLALAFHNAHFIPIDPAPSMAVLAFAFGLSLLTGIVFGTAPAWFAVRTNPIDALRGGGQRSTGERSSFSRNALLAMQAALSVALVAGAAMLARSLTKLEHQNWGFPIANRMVISVNPLPATYTPERLTAVYRSLQDRLLRLPGVEGAELALYNPFTDNWGELIYVAGRPPVPISENSTSSWDRVSNGYLQTLGQAIIRGRMFSEQDTDKTDSVAVVNQAFVKRFFPNEDPIGKHFGLDLPENASTFRIVGVVQDSKFTQTSKVARPMFFASLAQQVQYRDQIMQRVEVRSHFIGGVLLRTHLPAGVLEPLLKKTFAEADPNFTIVSVRTLHQQIALLFDQQRAVASLAGLFGLVALLLAAVGLYGVTAYTVAQRTSEIGVRMALGADRANILKLVLRGAFQRVGFGLLLGIPLALAAGRLLSSQLYGVVSWDPWALLIATLSLAVCAFAAAIVPAVRAASIQPMKALRTE